MYNGYNYSLSNFMYCLPAILHTVSPFSGMRIFHKDCGGEVGWIFVRGNVVTGIKVIVDDDKLRYIE